jgi:hypothetical protein
MTMILRDKGPQCLSSPLPEDSLLGGGRAFPPRLTASPFLGGGERLFLGGGERLFLGGEERLFLR